MLMKKRLSVTVGLLFVVVYSVLFSFSVYGHGQKAQSEVVYAKGPIVTVLLLSILFIFLIFFAFYLILKNRPAERMNINLSHLPNSFKFLITLSLIILGTVHLLAIFNVYLHTVVESASVEEYFSFMELADLVSLSHVHLFGHLTMYFLIGIVFLLTRFGERFKIAVISLAILGAYLDVLSWWLIKYVSIHFEALSYLSGLSLSLGFLMMTLSILYELWGKKRQEVR